MSKEKIESADDFRRRMRTIKKLPAGFTVRFADHNQFGYKELVFIVEKPGDAKLEFRHERGDGTTEFHTKHGTRTFDRTGVDSSFYHRPFDFEKKPKPVDLNELVKEQLAKVVERRAYIDTSISIPSIGFRVAPEQVAEYKERLKKNGAISFTPSGFGTGYMVTKKPTRGLRFGESRAVPELEAFFGMSPLYVSTMDCD